MKTLKRAAVLLLFVTVMAFGTTVGPTLVAFGGDAGGRTSCGWVHTWNTTTAAAGVSTLYVNITTIGDVASVDWVKITITYTPAANTSMGRRVIRTQTRTFRRQRAA